MRMLSSQLSIPATLVALLAGCGSGDGPIASTPAPPINFNGAQFTGVAALVPPNQSATPSQPLATSATPTIANTGAQTVFPLVQTAVDRSFAGDAETTAKGASLARDAATGTYSLTLNNPALNATDVPNPSRPRLVDGKQALGTSIPGHRGLSFGVAALDYTAYGSWFITHDPDIGIDFTNGGAFVGGYVTPASTVPVSGSASYLGRINGLASEVPGYYQVFNGDVRFTADFAARTVTGTTSNGGLGSDNIIPPKLNDIAFSATYDPARNLFEGTVRALPGGTAFTSEASGSVSGRFFGPLASELGGVWTISEATRRIVGSFAAKRE